MVKDSPAMQIARVGAEPRTRTLANANPAAALIDQASRPARIVQAIIDQMPQVPEPRDPPTVTADGGDVHIHLHFYRSADDE